MGAPLLKFPLNFRLNLRDWGSTSPLPGPPAESECPTFQSTFKLYSLGPRSFILYDDFFVEKWIVKFFDIR